MWLIGFLAGYLCVLLPGAFVLGSGDFEPVGAQASLLLLGFVVAWLACAAYGLIGRVSGRSPKVVLSLISGALSSAVLLIALTRLQPGAASWVGLFIAAAASMVAATGASFYTTRPVKIPPNLFDDRRRSGEFDEN